VAKKRGEQGFELREVKTLSSLQSTTFSAKFLKDIKMPNMSI